jgi:putative ABC transport system permease protein
MGGDIVLSSGSVIDVSNQVFTSLREKILLREEYTLQSVFHTQDKKEAAAATVRAVDDLFPLYGEVQVSGTSTFSLTPGLMYAEPLFLSRLGVSVGDSVYIGTSSFMIAGVLVKEPDAVSVGVQFAPKVIITKADFLKTGIDVNQSRASHKVLIRFKDTSISQEDIDLIASYAKANKIRFDDASNGPNNFVRGLSSVTKFASIVLAIALCLVAVNIVANLTYVISRFKKSIALLKTFGATTRQIQGIYIVLLSILGLIAGGIGAYLGSLVANALLPQMSVYVGREIHAANSFVIAIAGVVSGGIISLVSALPFFKQLSDITPKELLLNGNLFKRSKGVANQLLYIPIPVLLGLMLYELSKDAMLTLYSIGALIILFSLFVVGSYAILSYIYRKRDLFSFELKTIVASLYSRGMETAIVSASIMTAFLGIFIVSAVEANITKNIEQNVSGSAPALYLVDITKSQLETVRSIGGPTFREYPIIRGRLLAINDKDMTTSENRGITREFNMTYRNALIDGETITQGIWHGTSQATSSVSFDAEFAEEVGGVSIGDTVTVFIQGLTVKATVTSIRETNRSNGTPFFYMVFSPDLLSRFPATYFATVNESEVGVAVIEREIGILYPNIIPIQTKSILETVTSLIKTILLVVKVIGVPSIILGLLLVFVMTGQSLYERKGDILVLRAFGLDRGRAAKLFMIEVGSLILLSALVSYALAHGIAYLLNVYVFSFSSFVFAGMPLTITALIFFVSMLTAYVIASRLSKDSLKKLLAEK